MKLSQAFFERPITHRGLHDKADGRPENSLEAFDAAIAQGYPIELDVQLSADGQAMVFHDYHLGRLTGEEGPVRQRDAAALGRIVLTGGRTGIPTLPEVLTHVAGRVPLLIEVKDQDGQMGPDIGPLDEAVAAALRDYDGEAAVMSFNPHSTARLTALLPDRPRGLTTSAFDPDDWAPLPLSVCERLREIPDYDSSGASFISHEVADLGRPRVADLQALGADILCWTVKSPQTERAAREVARNITFEGYLA